LVWQEGGLGIVDTEREASPTVQEIPLAACDMWDPAYSLVHRHNHAREGYLKAYWEHIHWGFVQDNLMHGGIEGAADSEGEQ